MNARRVIIVSCIWILQATMVAYILYVGPRYVSSTKEAIRDIGRQERQEKLEKHLADVQKQEEMLISFRNEFAATIDSMKAYSVNTSPTDMPNRITSVYEFIAEFDSLVEVKKITPLIVSGFKKYASLSKSLDAARDNAQRLLHVSDLVIVELSLVQDKFYCTVSLKVQNNLHESTYSDRKPWQTAAKIALLKDGLPEICSTKNFNCTIEINKFTSVVSISSNRILIKKPIDKSEVESILQSSVSLIDLINSYSQNTLSDVKGVSDVTGLSDKE